MQAYVLILPFIIYDSFIFVYNRGLYFSYIYVIINLALALNIILRIIFFRRSYGI